MTDRTGQMDKDHRGKRWLLSVLLLLIIVGVIVAFFLWPEPGDDNRQDVDRQSGSETQPAGGGERFAYSDFYHATDGTWIISDDGILVLKERKFITESEIDRYAVHKIAGRDRVRIIQSSRRWKRSQVIRDGKTIAEGWIDANFVRTAKRVESDE